ncbi:MAG: tRNA (adenosine(37)-N6)-threonylcarbamoyltransferase complex ATPase subunit type 1 TsaE [Boseongicola sp.]|nr:tRNA (adenosine(37)-N6)-threonylcarbamoyltransferase complex ATPase subunit type 1 TsaE [Boseongicola sp.]NNL17587.1 tRNA (adenosine(37)-N6)-threonylcarbamoyltransferase complex ATPase subunit type 1 TsaE [Boseongicola sp.]
MPSPTTVHLILPGPDDTSAVASQLAPYLRPGDCLLLTGSLGAGKTHFARALIQKRLSESGIWEDIPSPTYTLVQTYDDGVCEIWHADLYRLSDPHEIIELGLDDAFEKAITIIEWPDRLGELAPKNALQITLSVEGDSRTLAANWNDPRIAHLAAQNE